MRPLRAGRALLSGNEGTRRETVPRTNTFTEARNKLISLARILSKGHFCDSLAVILLNLNLNHEGMWFLGHTEVFQVFSRFFGLFLGPVQWERRFFGVTKYTVLRYPFYVNERFPKARGARTFTSAATSVDPYRFSGVGDLYIRDMPRATRARAAKGALREKTDGETNVVSPAPDAKAVGAVKAVAAAATDAAEAVDEEWSMEREFREIDEECEFPIAISR